jgi:predicted ATPase
MLKHRADDAPPARPDRQTLLRRYMPEVLRVKGRVLLSMPETRGDEAEACFMQSVELSCRHAALAWELRTAVDLAASWTAGVRRPESARTLLAPVYDRLTEGFETADLRAAERLLPTLG